jgi:hypothetical protein
MNHAVTDSMQAHDRELFGASFATFLPPIFLRVKVVVRHLAVERTTAEGASDWLYVGHMLSPFYAHGCEKPSLLIEQRPHAREFLVNVVKGQEMM